MADQSTQSITVAAPPADVMAVIADFPSYPEWVAAAKQVDVLEAGADGRARRVHFVLDAGAVKDDYVLDRKSTRLNSSHANISYAVFCLKKKNNYKSTLYSFSLHNTSVI